MAKNFLTPIDLNKNEIRNAVAQVLGSAPSSPVPGQFYYDSGTGRFTYRGVSAWIDPAARANHTGTQLAATISDLASTVQAYRLDQFAVPTADVSLNSHKLTNVTDGSSAQDAVTYNQLQAVLNGRTFKDAVRCASTANVASISGLLTLDGITVVAGDRVLLKNQTTGSQNGIYVAAGGAWSRAVDADSITADAELKAGTTVQITEGTTLADTQWTLTTNAPITVGTTALAFAQTGAGTTYTQGAGIAITGSSIAVDTAVVATKASATIGDGSTTSIAVTHGLGTKDVVVCVRQVSDDAEVFCDVVHTSTTQVTLAFTVAPATNSLRVTVIG